MSTLDERVGRKARSRRASGTRKATTSSRAAQGLPPKIEDDAVLDAAAALLADVSIGHGSERRDHARPA